MGTNSGTGLGQFGDWLASQFRDSQSLFWGFGDRARKFRDCRGQFRDWYGAIRGLVGFSIQGLPELNLGTGTEFRDLDLNLVWQNSGTVQLLNSGTLRAELGTELNLDREPFVRISFEIIG